MARRNLTGPPARRRTTLLLAIALIAGTLSVLGAASPSGAATMPAHNGATTGTWVDGSDRFHVLWSSTSGTGGSIGVDQLRVARHVAGTADLDPSFGTGGIREIPLVNPYGTTNALGVYSARVIESGMTADGTIVVAWLATMPVRLAVGEHETVENSHDRDRLVLDRYDLTGTRLSRAETTMPRNSWCWVSYGEKSWSDDFNTWITSNSDHCGDYDGQEPSAQVLPSGLLAVATTAHYQWPSGAAEPNGTSSLVSIDPTTASTVQRVVMPSSHWERHSVTGHADGGAVINTYNTTSCGPDGCTYEQGPSYVVAADWSSFRTVSVPNGCLLWAGAGGGTVRTCNGVGTLDLTVAGPTGATLWTRSVPAARGATAVAVQPDGRVSVVGFGCVDPAAACGPSNVLGLRLGATGDVDRSDLGLLFDPVAGANYTWHPPATLSGGAQIVATDHRPPGNELDHTVNTKILDSVAAGPTCTTGPPIITVSTRGTTTITFQPCPSGARFARTALAEGAPTGYVVEAVGGAGTVVKSVSVPADATSASITGLTVGERYRFRVRARNEAGLGPASAYSQWTTPGFTSFTTFVTRQYTDLVGRKPTSAELTTNRNALGAGTLKPKVLVDRLVGSTWTLGRVGQANRLSRTVLLRDLPTASLRTYVGKLRSGTTLTSIVAGWMRSSEYQMRYGRLSNKAFVETLYRNVLGRAGSAANVAIWTNRLNTRTRSRAQVLVAFSEGAEHVKRTAARHNVIATYFGMLGRPPTAGALGIWLPKMTGTTPRQPLIASVLASAEYDARIP